MKIIDSINIQMDFTEKKIILFDEFENTENNFSSEFKGTKWLKGLKIIGYVNGVSL